jgi:hypothetical protein
MEAAPLETVGVTTRTVVPLDQQHRLSSLCQQSGHAQAADACANDYNIVSFFFGFPMNAAH